MGRWIYMPAPVTANPPSIYPTPTPVFGAVV